MAQQVINIGTSPNDGTGDQLRTAFDKCNDNFTELYAGSLGDLQSVTDNGSTTTNNITISDGLDESILLRPDGIDHTSNDGMFSTLLQFAPSLSSTNTITIPNETGTIATQEWVIANPTGGAVDSVNGQTGVVVLDATDVDALKRDGSNANSDVDLGTYALNSKSLKVNGTAGSGHLGLKHQSSNATASGSETALFAGSDGELYYKNDGNTVEQVASESWVNTGLSSKQDTLVSGTNIKTLEGLNTLGSGDLEYFNNLFFEQNLGYMIPSVGGTAYVTLRNIPSILQLGQTADFNVPSRMLYASSTTIGSFCFQRGTQGGSYALSSTNKIYFKRRFQIDSNVSGSRFVCGLSNQFSLAAPTNVEPDTLINTIGVCKLSTSNNLFFFWNDATGLATTVDLGVNYPANNVTAYTYDLEIFKDSGTANITLKLTRIDASGNRISTSQVISSNYNTGVNYAAIYGTNNATAASFRFFDFGIIFKNYNPQWNTI